MVSERSQVKTAVVELEKELEVAKRNYNSVKAVLDAHNKERSKIGEKYGEAQQRVKEIEMAINTLSTLTN
jgi:chromosome segregation ATPase